MAQAWGTPPSYSRSPSRQPPVSEPYQSCSCESHRHRHEEINKLISKQYDFNCIITEETENIERQLLNKKEKVILAEVSLNEKRDEIAKLTAEIEHINPDILNLTDQELHDINLKMAEDVKILAEKVSNSPSGGNFGDNGFKRLSDGGPRSVPPNFGGYKRQISAESNSRNGFLKFFQFFDIKNIWKNSKIFVF